MPWGTAHMMDCLLVRTPVGVQGHSGQQGQNPWGAVHQAGVSTRHHAPARSSRRQHTDHVSNCNCNSNVTATKQLPGAPAPSRQV